MKPLLVLFSLLAGLVCPAAEPAPTSSKFYVQLVRGSNDVTPPGKEAKEVGEKIRKQLQPVFRWKHYWELQRTSFSVVDGKTGRTELEGGYRLEMDLSQSDKRTVRLFRAKKLVRTAVCPRDKEFCIQGLERDDGSVWFVVVRSDPPAS